MAGPQQQPLTDDEGRQLPIAPLHQAATDYVRIRDERMELTKAETEARQKVIAVMQKHELTVYNSDGVKVSLKTTTTSTVKVTIDAPAGDGDGTVH